MKQVDKKKIIDAAFHIFVRDKIESAKMSEIAQAAGVGRATQENRFHALQHRYHPDVPEYLNPPLHQ